MTEYLQIKNDEGTVIIDDSFRNYHYLHGYAIKCKNFTASSRFGGGGYYLYEHTFNVSSTTQPIAAYRAGNDDVIAMETVYEEYSPNNWRIRMYIHMVQFQYLPESWVTVFVYGLIPSGTPPSTGPVFQVFDANHDIVYDSGRKPMFVEGYYSSFGAADWYPLAPGYLPNSWSEIEWNIPNYKPDKVYAVISGAHIFRSMYSNPNAFYYLMSYIYRSNEKFKIGFTTVGIGGLVGHVSTDMQTHTESFVLIDVTGIQI